MDLQRVYFYEQIDIDKTYAVKLYLNKSARFKLLQRNCYEVTAA